MNGGRVVINLTPQPPLQCFGEGEQEMRFSDRDLRCMTLDTTQENAAMIEVKGA